MNDSTNATTSNTNDFDGKCWDEVIQYILNCPYVSNNHPSITVAIEAVDLERQRQERDAKLRRKFSNKTTGTTTATAVGVVCSNKATDEEPVMVMYDTTTKPINTTRTIIKHTDKSICVTTAETAITRPVNTVADLSELDQAIMNSLNEYKNKYKWPKKRGQVEYFSQVNALQNLRLHHSNGVRHEKVRAPKTKKNVLRRYQCRLCYKPPSTDTKKRINRGTCFMCSLCEVPLCTTPFKPYGTAKTCFERWHSAQDLPSAHSRCQVMLAEWRERQVEDEIEENLAAQRMVTEWREYEAQDEIQQVIQQPVLQQEQQQEVRQIKRKRMPQPEQPEQQQQQTTRTS